MDVKDLQLNKWYLVLINDNLLRSRYDGKQYVDNKTYYVFLYYHFNEGELFHRYIKEEDVSKLVQEIPFNYRSAYGGVGGLKRWLNQLTNLLV